MAPSSNTYQAATGLCAPVQRTFTHARRTRTRTNHLRAAGRDGVRWRGGDASHASRMDTVKKRCKDSVSHAFEPTVPLRGAWEAVERRPLFGPNARIPPLPTHGKRNPCVPKIAVPMRPHGNRVGRTRGEGSSRAAAVTSADSVRRPSAGTDFCAYVIDSFCACHLSGHALRGNRRTHKRGFRYPRVGHRPGPRGSTFRPQMSRGFLAPREETASGVNKTRTAKRG